jgi:hypothetical protein
MPITNMFKRYSEDKWPKGGGGCVLISMKNIAPVDVYFPTGATVTEVHIEGDDGNFYTISASSYNRLYVDFRMALGTDASGPSDNVDVSSSYPDRVEGTSSSHPGFSSTYLIPMFVPQGWRLANGTKGCVLGSIISSYTEYSYGGIPDENMPLKNLRYSAVTNDTTDVNGVTRASCVCQNKGTENVTFSHIMLLSSTSSTSTFGQNNYKTGSLFYATNTGSISSGYVRNYPNGTYDYYNYSFNLPLYYLDDNNVMHMLEHTGSSNPYTTYDLFNSFKSNIQTNEYLTDVSYAALPIMAPMIIEELSAPVTLAPNDAYTISFTIDFSNRENWVRNRSDLDEGVLYYSGKMTGQFPTSSS